MYSLTFYTWPLSAECAMDLVDSTNQREDLCRVLYNTALVIMRQLPYLKQCSCNHCPVMFCHTSAQPRSQV
jgi:hypothetical protein